ncbi:unnamed protein product [Linum tenue]|uniref:Fe2OG dioxygenase domain-containing protein n=2 Tax=Linum tenue TaxID=586396 RepID=A0AAV0HXR7_9ROSI|nr:unnamed protein product [Linum tenue]CAI0388980.1 unnamed protein product [Linum tenue]
MVEAIDAPLPPTSTTPQVQDISLHGDDPPPRYIVRELPDLSPPSTTIPIIDLSRLLSGDEDGGREELGELKAALTSWGCFQLIGHGIPGELLDEVQVSAKQFFRLPSEEKQMCFRPEDDVEGYGNDPILSDKQILDWSDRLLLKLVPEDTRKLHLWPTNPTQFREVVSGYSDELKRIVEALMKAMARCVGLEEDCFLKQYGGKEMMMSRFNHYPVCPRPDVVLGVKAHSDGSGVTVLLQDDKVEGLQILKEGRWYGVPIIPHALVVNVGDQMQVCSLMNHNRRLLFEIKLTCGVEFGELGLYGILIRD